MKAKNKSSKQKYLVRHMSLALVMTLVIICVAAVFWISDFEKSTQVKIQEQVSELAHSMSETAAERLKSNLNYMDSIAFSYVREKKAENRLDLSALQKKAEMFDFSCISIYFPEGTAVCSCGKVHNFSKHPMLKRLLSGEKMIIDASEIYLDREDQKNTLALGVPVYEDGKISCALIASTDEDWVDSYLSKSYYGGEVYYHIINRDGDYVLKNITSYAETDDGYNYTQNVFENLTQNAVFREGSAEAVKEAAKAGESIFFRFSFSSDNKKRASELLPLENTDLCLWIVIVEASMDIHYKHFLTNIKVLSIVVVALFAVLTTLLYFVYRKSIRLAMVDPVTGGYTVTRFDLEAKSLLRHAPEGTYSLVAFDIDKFKLVNEMYGMQEGNKILSHVHRVIREHLREGELVARYSSDHYDILLREQDHTAILRWIDRVSQEINQFNDSHKDKFYVILNVGGYQIDSKDTSVLHCRDRANIARKKAKNLENHRLYSCAFYNNEDRERQQREKEISNCMYSALEQGEFHVYYQPKVDVSTGKIIGAEALVRWLDPRKGLIPPDNFIPLFERNGFVRQVDVYVFEQVCRRIRRWMDAGAELIPISVNLSRVHLSDSHFLDPFLEAQKKWDVPSRYLEMELTETVLQDFKRETIYAVSKMHEAGLSCSIDDFGSGFSSLNSLKDLDIDVLKLDRAFLGSGDGDNKKEQIIIEQIVNMTKRLGIESCMEGVETAGQFAFLQEIDCDIAQGYLFSKPVDVETFERMAFPDVVFSE